MMQPKHIPTGAAGNLASYPASVGQRTGCLSALVGMRLGRFSNMGDFQRSYAVCPESPAKSPQIAPECEQQAFGAQSERDFSADRDASFDWDSYWEGIEITAQELDATNECIDYCGEDEE